MRSTQNDTRQTGRASRLVQDRIRMTWLGMAFCAGDATLLALYALLGSGSVPLWAAWGYLAANGLLSCAYYLIYRSGLYRRFEDSYAVMPQYLATMAIQVAFALAVPAAAVIFLMGGFAVVAYAGLRVGLRRLLPGCALAVLGTALALSKAPGLPHTTLAEAVIATLAVTYSLFRLASIIAHGHMLRQVLYRRTQELDISLRQIERLAARDDLTGALNRRSMLIMLEEQLRRIGFGSGQLCVAMLDLDHFKRINDTFGHLKGDAVLKDFSELASHATRTNERIGRYGGEEFLAIVADTSLIGATAAIERIRSATASRDWSLIAPGLVVTVSAGVAAYQAGDSMKSLLQRADDALYQAKAQGRNRVVAADQG